MLPDVGAGPKPQGGGDLSGEQQKHLERLLRGWRWMETAGGGGEVPASPSLDTPSTSPAAAARGAGSVAGLCWCFSTVVPGFNPTVLSKSWPRLRVLEAAALLLACPALDATPAPRGPREDWGHSCNIFLA